MTIKCELLFPSVALWFFIVPQTFSQTLKENAPADGLAQELTITSIRPITDAVLEVQQRFNIPINIEELALPLQTSGPLPSMTVRFLANEKSAISQVSRIVTTYAQSGLSGKYSVIEQNGCITILPESLDGKAVAPVSQSRISIPSAERTVAETFDLVAAQISRVSGMSVMVFDQPFINGEKVQLFAHDETALAVLSQLRKTIGPIACRFVWDPKRKVYFLIVNAVPVDEPPHPTTPTPKLTSNPFFTKDK